MRLKKHFLRVVRFITIKIILKIKILFPTNDAICVDAASSGNPGIMEYQGVEMLTKKVLFKKGPYKNATNNIGEFLALVHGIAYLEKTKKSKIIYSDSKTAISWEEKNVKLR